MPARTESGAVRLVIFSALGSLPLHLAAVMVFAGTADGMGETTPGLLTSAILIGLFGSCLVQAVGPPQGFFFSNRLGLLVGCQVGLLLIAPLLPDVVGAIAWFAIGWISGVYMYQGMVVAANAANKYLGFLARVVFAMFLSGIIAVGVCHMPRLSNYASACVLYAIVVATVYMLTRPEVLSSVMSAEIASDLEADRPALSIGTLAAQLLPVVLFFAGSVMFASHIAGFVGEAGDVSSMNAFGIAKIVGGLVLALTLTVSRLDSGRRLVMSAIVMVVAMAILGPHGLLPAVFVVLGFEIALNIGGAAFMAEVARHGQNDIKRYIPAAGLIGTAIGPITGSFLLTEGSHGLLRWLAIGTVAAGVVWLGFTFKGARNGRKRLMAA